MSEYNKEKSVRVILNSDLTDIYYDVKTDSFNNFTREQYLRYLKGKYSNKERFFSRFVNANLDLLQTQYESKDYDGKQIIPDIVYEMYKKFFETFTEEEFENATPFNYAEVFKLESVSFQKAVFDTIDIQEMMESLGAERVMVEGIQTNNKIFNQSGKLDGVKEIHNVFELYKAKGDKLGLPDEDLYAIKCWCTSTNNEHFIWVSEEDIKNPLQAIASTFQIHSNLKPHIKALKRQGDLLVVELNKEVKPEGEMVKLTAEEYFGLLESQS